MFRTVAALALAVALSGASVPARAGQADAVASVSARADAKAMSLDLLRVRYEFAADRSDNELRLSLLKEALDTMSEADPDEVKAIRSSAALPGASVPVGLHRELDRLDRLDARVDAFVAALVTSAKPIALAAEADDADSARVDVVAGPAPVAVRIADQAD